MKNGRLFFNEYRKFCCGGPTCMFEKIGFELELEGQTIVESEHSWICPICGPYKVRDGNQQQIGELEPNCYVERFINPFAMCIQCCAKLQVKDSNNREIYSVSKDTCTCFCCSKWTINGQGGKQGSMEAGGCFCNPELKVQYL